MNKRNTIQKELVLNAVHALRSHVTADEVYEQIKKDYSTIGKGTVYRNLGILADEGKIRRVAISNGPDRFDFTLEDHYHVECVKCGNVLDVDMEVLPDIKKNIIDTHGIDFLGYEILFKGVCPACQG